MPNFNKLFTLDAETLDILKEQKNQSEFVRKAVKQFEKYKTITTKPQIQEVEMTNIEVEL